MGKPGLAAQELISRNHSRHSKSKGLNAKTCPGGEAPPRVQARLRPEGSRDSGAEPTGSPPPSPARTGTEAKNICASPGLRTLLGGGGGPVGGWRPGPLPNPTAGCRRSKQANLCLHLAPCWQAVSRAGCFLTPATQRKQILKQ